jgi:hypothetical protein
MFSETSRSLYAARFYNPEGRNLYSYRRDNLESDIRRYANICPSIPFVTRYKFIGIMSQWDGLRLPVIGCEKVSCW